jgi:AcrR family transcriptional regulator
MSKKTKPKPSDVKAGIAAARRSLELLWGVQRAGGRGPRPGLTVERIVETAIAVADREGLEAVSMRRVAEELGAGAMSLYTYVPGKVELLELMYDAVLGEDRWSYAEGSDWRDKLAELARREWALYARHPWMLDVPWARSPLGPSTLAGYERALSAVAGLGLGGKQMLNVVNLISIFVRGVARVALEARTAGERDGLTDEQWWAAREPFLMEQLVPSRFPILTSPEMHGAFDQTRPDVEYSLAEALDSFDYGLARILDGIAAAVTAHTPRSRRPRRRR